MIDFRSDTVTVPSKEMREFMMNAPVGDDVFAEDPTVNELEKYSADLFGKEAALYCASGTQTNQIAINVHTQPGGEVICHWESHIYKYEGGGIAKNSGVSVRLIDGDRGRVKVADIQKWENPDDVHYPITQLVSLEDTANRGGGAVYDYQDIINISDWCQKKKLPLHLDGARLMNALAYTGQNPQDYAKSFDSISLCLSKGLGAPVGSVLIGSTDFIKKARRVRKAFGGGMRQAGMIAAGGLFALKNNVARLKLDYQHALLLEENFNQQTWVSSIMPVMTNIVVLHLKDKDKRDQIIQKYVDNGIRCMAFGEGMVRFVTHLNISESDIQKTIEVTNRI
jgi:threonine aldolase